MKNSFLPLLFLFLISCGDDKSVNNDSLRADSALKAQQMKDSAPPPVAVSKDTMHLTALPPVFEGDIVMQISEDPMLVAFGDACKSKYNNAGMIFMRPRDNAYMVLEMRDSIRFTPLQEWIDRGKDKHIALIRLKNSNQILNASKTERLKKIAKAVRGKSVDYAYSWTDAQLYSTEMVWKLYHSSLNISICEIGKRSEMNMTDAATLAVIKKMYPGGVISEEQFISPDAIYKSPKLEIIYEH
jgi:hypothetical protein